MRFIEDCPLTLTQKSERTDKELLKRGLKYSWHTATCPIIDCNCGYIAWYKAAETKVRKHG